MVKMLKREILEDGAHYVELACLAGDDKPVNSCYATGSLCLEVDTGDVYAFDEEGAAGSEWLKICELGGSGS